MQILIDGIKKIHRFLSHHHFYPIALSTFLVFLFFVGRIYWSQQVIYQNFNLELVFSLAAIFVLSWRCRNSSSTSVLVVGNDHSSRFMGDIFTKCSLYCD